MFKQAHESFCAACNPRSHLVRSNLHPLNSTTGSHKCNTPRCQAAENVSNTTKETFKINYFDYNSKSLNYLIFFEVFGKQY